MHYSIRNLILAFLMLWLPLQGFAMTGMDECHHGSAEHETQVVLHQAHHGTHINQAPIHHDEDGAGCVDCDFCHQCSAAAIPMQSVVLQMIPATAERFLVAEDFSTHFPEPPKRPPLAMPS